MIERLVKSDDLPQRLADELIHRGVHRRDGERFAPELSYGRHFGPPPHDARPAAVIALLFPRHGHWHIALTVRHAELGKHGGQISLPGGSVDAGETTGDAARRELFEELGVAESVQLLGELSGSYVYVSNFRVTPWLAATNVTPAWQPHDREVERVVEVPLELLVDSSCLGTTTIERGPVTFRAPCYWVGADCVWGATSIILGQLAGLLRRISEDSTRDD